MEVKLNSKATYLIENRLLHRLTPFSFGTTGNVGCIFAAKPVFPH